MRPIDADDFRERMDMICDAGGYLQPITEAVREYVKTMIDRQPTVEAEPDKGWISVDDRLPEKEQKVLVFYKALGEENRIHNDVMAINWRTNKGDFMQVAGYKVTHWRPLPEPPKED